jgi:hypothetical protein
VGSGQRAARSAQGRARAGAGGGGSMAALGGLAPGAGAWGCGLLGRWGLVELGLERNFQFPGGAASAMGSTRSPAGHRGPVQSASIGC